jgi:pimeloyl-ACP methyl ester carboxylesterase
LAEKESAMMVVTIVVSVLAALVLLGLALSYTISLRLLYPPRQPIGRTPREYGMDCEDIEFRSADGIKLKGWFIPEPGTNSCNRVIVFVHAMSFNRHGWSAELYWGRMVHQPSVDFLPLIKALNKAGNSIFMFDLGNHGESDARRMFGGGLNEYQDVAGAVEYVKSRHHQDPPQIGIIGVCGGANSTVIAMSKAKEALVNTRFLVLLQPITPRTLVHGMMKAMFGFLGLILVPALLQFYRWQGGYSLEEMSPMNYAKDVEIPTLIVQAEADTWTTLTDITGIYGDVAGPKQLWLIEGKMKRFDTYLYFNSKPDRIIEFAREHFAAPPGDRAVRAGSEELV